MKRFLKLAATLALVAVVLWIVGDPRAIAKLFAQMDGRYVLVAAAVATIDRVLMTFKWGLLLRAKGMTLPLWRGTRIYCASMIWGMFLPSTVGADAIRTLLTHRAGIDGKTVVASIVIERIIGFLSASLLGLISFAFLRNINVIGEEFDTVLYAGALLLAAGTAVFALSLTRSWYDRLVALLPSGIARRRIVIRLTELHRTYVGYAASRRILGTFFALTFAEQLLPILYSWVLAAAFGVDITLILMAGVIPLTLLIARLPISIDGIGLYESTFIALMALGGVPPPVALSIALAGRIVQTLAWLPWWFAYTLELGQLKPPHAET